MISSTFFQTSPEYDLGECGLFHPSNDEWTGRELEDGNSTTEFSLSGCWSYPCPHSDAVVIGFGEITVVNEEGISPNLSWDDWTIASGFPCPLDGTDCPIERERDCPHWNSATKKIEVDEGKIKMKRTINGVKYDSDKGIEVAHYSNGFFHGEPNYEEETLYCTPGTNRFFILGSGGSRTKYCTQNSESFFTLSKAEALRWLQDHQNDASIKIMGFLSGMIKEKIEEDIEEECKIGSLVAILDALNSFLQDPPKLTCAGSSAKLFVLPFPQFSIIFHINLHNPTICDPRRYPPSISPLDSA